MSLEIFWLLGLLAIGVVAFLLSKSVKTATIQDTKFIRNVVMWGCVLATLWIVYGGALVFDYIANK